MQLSSSFLQDRVAALALVCSLQVEPSELQICNLRAGVGGGSTHPPPQRERRKAFSSFAQRSELWELRRSQRLEELQQRLHAKAHDLLPTQPCPKLQLLSSGGLAGRPTKFASRVKSYTKAWRRGIVLCDLLFVRAPSRGKEAPLFPWRMADRI